MKTFIIAVLVLLTSACGTSPYLTPGVTISHMSEAKRACKDYQGVHTVSPTIKGYFAYCNNDMMVKL